MRKETPTAMPVFPEQAAMEHHRSSAAQSVLGGATAPEDYYNASVNAMRRASVTTGPHVKTVAMSSDPEIGHAATGTTPDPSTGVDSALISAARQRYSGGTDRQAEMAKVHRPTSLNPPGDPATLDPKNEKSVERALRAGLFDDILKEQQPPASFMEPTPVPKPETKKRRSFLDALPALTTSTSSSALYPQTQAAPQVQPHNSDNVSKYSIVGLINAAKKKRESA